MVTHQIFPMAIMRELNISKKFICLLQGLCIGDRIIRVNGISFVKISHHAAVHILSQPMAFDVIIDTSAREHVRTTHSEVSGRYPDYNCRVSIKDKTAWGVRLKANLLALLAKLSILFYYTLFICIIHISIFQNALQYLITVEVHAVTESPTRSSYLAEARCDPRLVQNWPSNTRRLNSLSELGNEEPSNTKTRTRTIDVQTDSDGYLGCSIRG